MGNTYHQIYIQAVFAVKYRNAVINKAWKPQLLGVLGNLVNETGCKTILVNGVEDHIHCFFGLKPDVAVSDVMKATKAKSSKWVNESGLLRERFEWQRGFGAFSYNQRDVAMIYNYIKNQETHHNKQSFRKEYLELLREYDVEFDDRYVLDDLK